MQEILDKLKDNPRIIVATLITAGVVALAVGNNGTTDEIVTDVTEDTPTSQTETTPDAVVAEDESSDSAEIVIGSEPTSGPVEVAKEDTSYSATVRSGDNQTVISRQMVNDYLGAQSQSLSAEQRLYVETVVVDSLPRNDVIFVGDVVEVDETVIADAVAASGELTEAQIANWSTYL